MARKGGFMPSPGLRTYLPTRRDSELSTAFASASIRRPGDCTVACIPAARPADRARGVSILARRREVGGSRSRGGAEGSGSPEVEGAARDSAAGGDTSTASADVESTADRDDTTANLSPTFSEAEVVAT